MQSGRSPVQHAHDHARTQGSARPIDLTHPVHGAGATNKQRSPVTVERDLLGMMEVANER